MSQEFKLDLPRNRAAGHTWKAVGLGLICTVSAWAEDVSAIRPPEFRHMAPLLSVRQAATAAGITLTGKAQPVMRNRMEPGDAVTVLVSLNEGKKLKQWVIELEAREPNEAERKKPMASARYYSNTGHEFVFGGGRSALQIRMLGPLTESDAGRRKATVPEVDQLRVIVSADYLALGLDRMPRTVMRLKAESEKAAAANPNGTGVDLRFAEEPFSAEELARIRQQMDAVPVVLAAADEEAFIGSTMAMREFFTTVSHTPGLKDVLATVLDIPWWSIITSGGKTDIYIMGLPFDAALDSSSWGRSADEKIYASTWKLEINRKPALLFQLAVTAPRPPLTTSAGIIGLAAGPPDGEGPVLTMTVVSTRTAGILMEP